MVEKLSAAEPGYGTRGRLQGCRRAARVPFAVTTAEASPSSTAPWLRRSFGNLAEFAPREECQVGLRSLGSRWALIGTRLLAAVVQHSSVYRLMQFWSRNIQCHIRFMLANRMTIRPRKLSVFHVRCACVSVAALFHSHFRLTYLTVQHRH